jgi:glutathione S-transferase
MITLYGFGPYLGMPDGSPYVMKGEILLRMAGLAYTKAVATGGPDQGPKGKLPYIDDEGEIVADTSFIRAHIVRKYGFDFDRSLDPVERAEAWAIERMIEDHLYWCCLHMRWGIDRPRAWAATRRSRSPSSAAAPWNRSRPCSASGRG